MAEYFDIVDDSGCVIGRAERSEVHGNPALIHRSVHVLVMNSRGELYLQKRSADKDIQPDKWDTSVGGHVNQGEEVLQAALREADEELLIMNPGLRFIYSYLWRSPVETELVTTYLCTWDGPIVFQREEISDGRFWSFKEIERNLGRNVFTPNFEEEYSRLKEILDTEG